MAPLHRNRCWTNNNNNTNNNIAPPARPPLVVVPPWARVSVPIIPVDDSDGDDADATVVAHPDDVYLRTLAYHAVAQRLDRAVQRALLAEAEAPWVFPAKDEDPTNRPQNEDDDDDEPATGVEPDEDSAPSSWSETTTTTTPSFPLPDCFTLPSAAPASEPNSSQQQQQQQEANPSSHNPWTPLLLPLTVLEGPWDGRDRAAWMWELVRHHRRPPQPLNCRAHSRRRRRTVLYWPCGTTSSSQQQAGRMIHWARFLRQRIESAVAAAAADDANHSNHSTPEDILIFVDGDPPTDFWTWCADRRANHGWPLRVVWMRPPHRSKLQSSSFFAQSAPQSAVGWRVDTVVLPTAERVLERFQQELIQLNVVLEWNGNTSANNNAAAAIRNVFAQQNRSVVHVVQQLKQMVAEQLSVPGAWWCMAHHFLVAQHARRMTALLLDAPYRSKLLPQGNSSATAMLEWLVSLEVRRQLVDTVRKVQTILGHKYDSGEGSVLPLFSPIIIQQTTATTDHNLTDEDRRILLQPVAQASMAQTSTLPPTLSVLSAYSSYLCPTDRDLAQRLVREHLTHALHQLIVGLDQCTTAGQVQHFLAEMLRRQTPRTDTAADTPDDDHDSTNGVPQPRRDIVSALLDDFDHDDDSNAAPSSEIHIPGQLYRLLLDRTAVELGEWFRAWVAATRPNDDDHAALQYGAFGCGIRHLQLLGLIRPRSVVGPKRCGATTTTTTTRAVWFEKTALVWCGGES